ncbi:unnamed protein product, partial [Prorocentrum cordatum]
MGPHGGTPEVRLVPEWGPGKKNKEAPYALMVLWKDPKPQAFGSSQDAPIPIPCFPSVAAGAAADGSHAAAAAADGTHAAVAAYRADLDAIAITQPFKLNSIVLKWLWDSHEEPPGCPSPRRVDVADQGPLDIGVLERTTGMADSFKAGETQPWSWRQMLSAMTRDAKDRILGRDQTTGVIWATCEPVGGSHDHKRWRAARQVGRPFPEQ